MNNQYEICPKRDLFPFLFVMNENQSICLKVQRYSFTFIKANINTVFCQILSNFVNFSFFFCFEWHFMINISPFITFS